MTTDRMLQFFEYGHLPEHLKEVSLQFANLATWMVWTLPMNAERTAGLRKLLEAKDCAVRARLYKEPSTEPSAKKCPYAKSDMTPCVLRDGAICFASDGQGRPICVGCEHSPAYLGVPLPVPWPPSPTKRK